MLNEAYGKTGPSAAVLYSCLHNRQDWITLGGILNYILPSPPAVDGTTTAAIDITATANMSAAAATYTCIASYSVSGTVLKTAVVTSGDAGVTACAAECDKLPTACSAHTTSVTGSCTLMTDITAKNGSADAGVQQLCFRNLQDFNSLGNPGNVEVSTLPLALAFLDMPDMPYWSCISSHSVQRAYRGPACMI
eukprot:jgi/Chrzof1/5737/Cz16g14010.t1